MSPPVVRLRGVYKRFGPVVALDGADFELAAGEIHGLLGENGAGKTTLMNVLAGLYRADAGDLEVGGRPVRIREPRDAVQLGVGMVHQHFELVGHFTALENVILGREGSTWLRPDRLRREVEALMERVGLAVPLDRRVRDLPVGVQQKVEILKALYRGARVLILDEPTTLLTPQEVDALFASLRTLVEAGVSVVFITHKLHEVLRSCDRVTVMRRGRRVVTVDRQEADPVRLVEWMVGTAPPPPPAREATRPGSPVLELEAVRVVDPRGFPVLDGCSLVVREGELVGVAGVSGNGQQALAAVVAGTARPVAGVLRIQGRPALRHGVLDRVRAGVLSIPEDRLRDGILPRMSVAENVVLGRHRLYFPGVRYDPETSRRLARHAIEEFRIVCPGPDAAAGQLSGGNLQRLIAARVFDAAREREARLLVAHNPTRGLDVPSTEFLHARLVEFCGKGGAVLLISEDLDELLKLADRIVVLYRGRVVAEFAREQFDRYAIGRAMTGGVLG
ncbi:MAG: ABC transporter ATP-binding protein [bacterium]